MEEKQTKQCQFCAEEVKIEAKKCKHCGSELGEEKNDIAENTENIKIGDKNKRIEKANSWFALWFVIWLFLIPFTAGVSIVFLVMLFIIKKYDYLEINNEEIILQTGLILRNKKRIPFSKIQNTDLSTFIWATIKIDTAGSGVKELVFSRIDKKQAKNAHDFIFAKIKS